MLQTSRWLTRSRRSAGCIRFAPAVAGAVLLVWALPSDAGVRTRAVLPEIERVESSLRARAEAQSLERLHAIVRVSKAEQRRARSQGVDLLRSIDGDLWLASVPVEQLTGGASTLRAWDLRPEDRCAPGTFERLAAEAPERLLRFKVFRDASVEDFVRALEDAGADVRSVAGPLGVIDAKLDVALVRDLASRDELRWFEPISEEYDLANNGLRVDAEVNGAQGLGLSGTGVVMGMWDSGVPDITHPDLAGRITVAEAGLLTTPHATHVSGTAIGDGTNSENEGGGGLQWRGVATGSSLISYGIDDHLAETDSAIVQYDIDLSTNSWVYPVGPANCDLYGDYASSAPEFDAIVTGAYGKPIPVLFAAGNERDDGDCSIVANGGYSCIPPPGTAKNVITVAAHQSDAGHMTPFSSWGPTDDGRMKPDLSGPGCQMSGDFGITSTGLGGAYGTMCGTSMATPAVAGGVAMILEEWAARFTGAPRPATSKALLGGFAEDRATAGPDYRFGLGAMQLHPTIEALQTMTTVEDVVADGATETFTFEVPASWSELKVTLVWDDPAASELADTVLVNDLDLELIAPTAGTFLPFVLDPANPTAAAVPGTNRLDNVEQVVVASPEAGTWTARVIGFDVPQGPQEFSVVGWDGRPPADAASLVAVAVDDTSATVNWIRAGDADRAGTLVVRSIGPAAWTPTAGTAYTAGQEPSPGVFVVAADDGDYSVTPLAQTDLAPGTEYTWTAFSYDEIPNYAPGVTASAMTTTNAVDVPVAAPSTPGVTFARTGANPLRTSTEFRFNLPQLAWIELDVVDAAGRRVASLLRGERKAGSHVARWDGRSESGGPVAAGVYFVRFRAGAQAFAEKVLVVR